MVSGSSTFFYCNGAFCKPYSSKYIVIAAPSGAVVPMVPEGHKVVVVGGTTYHEYNGVRYEPVLADGRTVYVVR